jgi:hypothetical protein
MKSRLPFTATIEEISNERPLITSRSTPVFRMNFGEHRSKSLLYLSLIEKWTIS